MLHTWSRTVKKKAFTLLELIVVIVVLGVLAAIAVPTFQAVIQRSSDEATLTSLRAMAREAQALEAFDQNGWNDADVTTAASDTSAAAPGVYAASLKAVKDAGKDPAPGEVTYVIDGAGLALSKLSDSGRVCVVGANYSAVEKGSCGPSTATTSSSTLGVMLSDPTVETFPAGTETVSSQVTAPGAPTAVAATAGDASAVVSFTPGTDGGGTVSYTVTSTPGGIAATGSGSPIMVSGLTNGTSYTFTVTATNSAGSTVSAASNSVTPVAPVVQADLTNATWVSSTSLPTVRYHHATTEDRSGLLYAIGGSDGTNQLDSVVRFDPDKNTWAAVAPLPFARQYNGAATDKDGRIYSIGGHNGAWVANVDRYDPATNTWTAVAPLPKALGAIGVTTDASGLIYVAGGFTGANSADVYRYDPTENVWTTLAPLPSARHALTLATGSSGEVYAIGGHNGSTMAEMLRYDPVANSWSALAPMGLARFYHSTEVDGQGRIYAIGNNGADRHLVERYDPSTNTWSAAADLPSGRYAAGAGKDSSGRIYLVGGSVTTVSGGTTSNAVSSSVLRLG